MSLGPPASHSRFNTFRERITQAGVLPTDPPLCLALVLALRTLSAMDCLRLHLQTAPDGDDPARRLSCLDVVEHELKDLRGSLVDWRRQPDDSDSEVSDNSDSEEKEDMDEADQEVAWDDIEVSVDKIKSTCFKALAIPEQPHVQNRWVQLWDHAAMLQGLHWRTASSPYMYRPLASRYWEFKAQIKQFRLQSNKPLTRRVLRTALFNIPSKAWLGIYNQRMPYAGNSESVAVLVVRKYRDLINQPLNPHSSVRGINKLVLDIRNLIDAHAGADSGWRETWNEAAYKTNLLRDTSLDHHEWFYDRPVDRPAARGLEAYDPVAR